ncbi:baculoviral IAP repeat-containing protein 1-like [Cloeon dipterum]|uniref:baculoviral IAP repeat-containing protein 1-like n=1 Tax=Cloeon dipterum TaxID=197152 RepID=UPI00321FA17D
MSSKIVTHDAEKVGAPTPLKLNLNLSLAMHRLFTFPLLSYQLFQFELLHALSDLGFYFANGCMICNFCGFIITTGQLSEYFNHGLEHVQKVIHKLHRNCKIGGDDSENVPMGKSLDDHLNYKYEAHRLYSLLKKNDWQFVEPFSLAKSGFYYSGHEDNVICAYCNLEVRGWEEGDTPDGEHRRWNPNCPFLCDCKSVINISIGSEQIDGIHANGLSKMNIGRNPFALTKGLEIFGPNIHFVIKSSLLFLVTPRDLNIQDWFKPLNPKFATLNSRLNSFKGFWPKCLNQTLIAMSRAGFFYTGTGDRAICFHCNLGLKDWDPNDDPFIQHCKWNSNCQYISRMSKVERSKDEITNAPAKRCTDGDILCLKCSVKNVSKVNLPCGHMTFCNSCSGKSCLVCRSDIIAEINVLGFSNIESEEAKNEDTLSCLIDDSAANNQPKQGILCLSIREFVKICRDIAVWVLQRFSKLNKRCRKRLSFSV